MQLMACIKKFKVRHVTNEAEKKKISNIKKDMEVTMCVHTKALSKLAQPVDCWTVNRATRVRFGDHEILSKVHCLSMYRSNKQFLVKVKAYPGKVK